ncbi:MAG: 30S ribosomal protein S11 [Clostridia bacterium]|nr:30S ribosomal protein S11 [Clostridia bacterium]
MLRGKEIASASVKLSSNRVLITLTDDLCRKLAQASVNIFDTRGVKRPESDIVYEITSALEKTVKKHSIKKVRVIVNGRGVGFKATHKALRQCGLEVLCIKDMTPIPHNVCICRSKVATKLS